MPYSLLETKAGTHPAGFILQTGQWNRPFDDIDTWVHRQMAEIKTIHMIVLPTKIVLSVTW